MKATSVYPPACFYKPNWLIDLKYFHPVFWNQSVHSWLNAYSATVRPLIYNPLITKLKVFVGAVRFQEITTKNVVSSFVQKVEVLS